MDKFWRILPWVGILLLLAANVSGLLSEDGLGMFELLLGLCGLAFFLSLLARGGRRPNAKGYAITIMYVLFFAASGIMVYFLSLNKKTAFLPKGDESC